MSALDSPVFCDLLRDVAKDRPQVGQRWRVTEGKRAGVEGVITWHGVDRFDQSRRYGDEALLHLRDCMGIVGFRVRIQPDDGEPFFIDARKIKRTEES